MWPGMMLIYVEQVWNKCSKADTISAITHAALALASVGQSKGHGTLRRREHITILHCRKEIKAESH